MVEPPNDRTGLPDYELLKAPAEPIPEIPPQRAVGWWVAAGLVLAALIVYVAFGRRGTPPPGAPAPQQVAAQPSAPGPRDGSVQPLGGEAAPIAVPPLDQSDPTVRELVGQITAHPRVLAWLATDGLIRAFTAAVVNIAEGRTPAVHFRVLRPSSRFAVVERDGILYLDPRSYARYDALAGALASIEPANAARLYATLKPRIEEAYRDLGQSDASFDNTLERAIVVLLDTPVPGDAVRLRRPTRGIGYAFADADLETLTAAQRQLLRMGPDNVREIQASLHAIAGALGIPAERLPAPPV
jgi:hypothetical protein